MNLQRSAYDQLVKDGLIDSTKISRPLKESEVYEYYYNQLSPGANYETYERYELSTGAFVALAAIAGVLGTIFGLLLAYWLT